MTACAMTVGMVPMALALEQGSQMQAPLGRAVIGGLVMSTFATLLVVPSIFALVIGRQVARSPSIYPDDPESAHYDPMVFAGGQADTAERRARPLADAGGHGAGSDSPTTPEATASPGDAMRRELGPSPGRPLDAPPLARRSPMHRDLWPDVTARSAGCRRLAALAPGRPRGAGLRPRGQDRLHERLGAPDRAG